MPDEIQQKVQAALQKEMVRLHLTTLPPKTVNLAVLIHVKALILGACCRSDCNSSCKHNSRNRRQVFDSASQSLRADWPAQPDAYSAEQLILY